MPDRITFFSSAARTVDENSIDMANLDRWAGLLAFLDITAASGTLDVRFQWKDWLSGSYVDIPGAAFASKTATGTDTLLIYPGVTEVANESVDELIIDTIRAVADLGVASNFTFSLSAVLIPPGMRG